MYRQNKGNVLCDSSLSLFECGPHASQLLKNAEFTGFLPYYSMFFSSKDCSFERVSGHYIGSEQHQTGAGCTMIADCAAWFDPTASD
jgi:hypothetical protein